MADTSEYRLYGAAVADAVEARIEWYMSNRAADCGIGTVTAVAPGGATGTVNINTGSGTAFKVRHASGYSPTIGDKVKWSRSQVGDWFVDYKLA